MDTKEALNIIKTKIKCIEIEHPVLDGYEMECGECEYKLSIKEQKEALENSINALEKHIPKKPKNLKSILDFSGRYYTSSGDCPTCGAEERYKSMLFCDKCGQKLDWGEE